MFGCRLSRVTDVIVDVAGWKDSGFHDAVVVPMVDDQQSAGSHERPEVGDCSTLLRQSAVEVWKCRQRVAETEDGVETYPGLHVLHVPHVVLQRQPVSFLDNWSTER